MRFRALGERFTAAFAETPQGKAAFDLMKLLGPLRSLERLQRSVRAANNYVQVSAEVQGPSTVVLRVAEAPGTPEYFQGILEKGLKLAVCTQGAQVEIASTGRDGHRYRIRWGTDG